MAIPLLTFDAENDPYDDEHDNLIEIDLNQLIRTRMLLQANSGGGKSWALRWMLENSYGKIQHLVLDHEGEFASLREKFDYLLVGDEGDIPIGVETAPALCRKLVEMQVSAIIDLYSFKDLEERRAFVKAFLDELIALPRQMWHPLLLAIDEAQFYCPEKGKGQATSTQSVIACCSNGRKRGYGVVLATQRLSKLNKDAAAELLNVLIGRTGLDTDLQRAGEDLGFDKETRAQLKILEPGTFFAYGPAIAENGVIQVRVGQVITTHPEPGKITPPPPPGS